MIEKRFRCEFQRDGICPFLNDVYRELSVIRQLLDSAPGRFEQDIKMLMLHNRELVKENRLLKESLREELQDNGNAYYIEIFDELFNLNYDNWDANEPYREHYDWKKLLEKKEGR